MSAPRGFIQYNVMVAMLERNGLTSKEIRQVAYEAKYGKGTFKPFEHRGHYSGCFRGIRPDLGNYSARTYGTGWLVTQCNKIKNKYYLNNAGRETFKRLTPKFAGRTIDAMMKAIEFNKKYQPTSGNRCMESLTANRVECSNGLNVPEKEIIELSVNGLKLDDEVYYYDVANNKIGEGYIQSIMITSSKIVNNYPEISINIGGSSIPGIIFKNGEFWRMPGTKIAIQKI